MKSAKNISIPLHNIEHLLACRTPSKNLVNKKLSEAFQGCLRM